jgi:hypothetical protein
LTLPVRILSVSVKLLSVLVRILTVLVRILTEILVGIAIENGKGNASHSHLETYRQGQWLSRLFEQTTPRATRS